MKTHAKIRVSPATIRTYLIFRRSTIETHLTTFLRTIPTNHSPFFRAAIKTNPYSQTFITAIKRQKFFARSPFSLSSTQSQRKRNLRKICLDFSKQPLKSSQHRQTRFHHPAIFLSAPGDRHKLYSFLNPNKQHPLFKEQRQIEKQQKQYESTRHKLQKESVYQLQTDFSPSFASPPTSLLSTVKKKKQRITIKRQIDICHQLSPSNLRSARLAHYSIMKQLFLPEFRYIKGSTTPENSTSNLPVESLSQRIKKNSHLLSFSPFFNEGNNVIRVGGRLAKSPYIVDKKFPIIIPKTSPLAELLMR